MKYSVLLLVLLAVPVSADVVIHQVLYDPLGSESGGEAVELLNTGDEPVDMSGWVLATESSKTDATIPEGTIVEPGQAVLVADAGWNASRDNTEWRPADSEERLTLSNADGGVALLANGEIVDAVGWGDADGIDEGLFEGLPAAEVKPGNALLRVQDSDDNRADMVEAPAEFYEGMPVRIAADVTLSAPVIEVSDALELKPEGVLRVKNNGDAPVFVQLVFNDLFSGEYRIPKSALRVDEDEFTVLPGELVELPVRLVVPENTVPGTYQSTLRVVVEK